ncbi:MAG: oligosaccharide flippase family protein [Bacteroidales bacterium]|jgi:PST family polysaccharide transporter|nr:oligosaccharide flippase family protein [Bacteroidales bacterium]
MFKYLKTKFTTHSKVVENYFFMTFLQGASMLISVLLYPYLIRVLGAEVYGTYVFVFSNVQIMNTFIAFGFTFPALKKISLFPTDKEQIRQTVSAVFTAKCLLLLFTAMIMAILIFFIPFVREHIFLYGIVFVALLTDILFPAWYFQALQRMRFVTFVNISIRLLTVPFIFIFIKEPADLLIYAFIVSVIPLLGSIFVLFYMRIKEKIKLSFVSLSELKIVFKDALPFFWTYALETIKDETVTFVIGTFFNMRDVALYDLAKKIVSIPRLMTANINRALFPNVIQNLQPQKIRKIIRYERFISLIIIVLIVSSGYWLVALLGGKEMLPDSYIMTIMLSVSVYTWLIVGCYINYLFVPQNHYYYVTKNQLVALLSFLAMTTVALLVHKSVIIIVLAFSLSHIAEIIYCKYIIKKEKML